MKRQTGSTNDTKATPKSPDDFIYLASQSPRRRQLLEQIGVRHELLLADASEDAEALEAERPGELPLAYVQRVTLAKLDAARQRLIRRGLPFAPILCSDTTVALGRRIYGKPLDAPDAITTLRALSGRTHRVITAVAVAGVDSLSPAGRGSAPASTESLAISVSRVTFAPLDAETIARYVASGEPFGKAGAYAIQGAAGAWVTRIDGSYTGIMGLPLHETAELLRAAGVRC
ncbi:MAG: Maf family protein [Burkholderiaceae bacterium]|nr:Maf family protein [Burkholderiaceae bacterium]